MKPTKYFVEIGSCDFDTLNETLGGKGWGGVVVEPVSEYLDNLTKHNSVCYINAALDVMPGTRTMNVFNKDVVSRDRDYAGMSSFAEYTNPQNEAHVTPRTVETVTYQYVIQKSGIPQVDFLKIDTEGHDMVVLNQVIYEGHWRPKVIKAEHKHIQGGAYAMKNFLEDKGYLVYQEFNDVYAIDTQLRPDPFGSHFEVNPNSAQYGQGM